MLETTKNQCPYCNSTEIQDTGTRIGEAHKLNPDGSYREPNHKILECKKCNEHFILKE